MGPQSLSVHGIATAKELAEILTGNTRPTLKANLDRLADYIRH